MQIGYDSVIVGIGLNAGQVLAGTMAAKIGKLRYQCMVAFLTGGIFFGCESHIVVPARRRS